MSALGILGGALGISSTIPGECWDQPGFKTCQTSAYNVARIECQALKKDNDACIVPRTDQIAMSLCKCVKKSAAPKPVVFSPGGPSKVELEPAGFSFLGMSGNTLLLVAAAAAGLYFYNQPDKKKG